MMTVLAQKDLSCRNWWHSVLQAPAFLVALKKSWPASIAGGSLPPTVTGLETLGKSRPSSHQKSVLGVTKITAKMWARPGMLIMKRIKLFSSCHRPASPMTRPMGNGALAGGPSSVDP